MSGYIVKCAEQNVWSGRDRVPEDPDIGHVIVTDVAEACPFDTLEEALTEAQTYAGGAEVIRDGRVVTRTGRRS